MTKEEIIKIFENSKAEWKGDNAFQGLQILSKYFDPEKEELIIRAEHDIFYSVSIDDFTNNRIQSYSLSIKTPRNPIYYLGNRNPYSIELNYPLEVNASFTIESDTYIPLHSQSFPCNNKQRNLTLTIKDYDNDSTIVSYGFSALSLINEDYNTNIDGNVTMNIDYQGFLTR